MGYWASMSGDGGGGSDGGCITCRRTDQISVFIYHQISILRLMETRFLRKLQIWEEGKSE